MSWSFSAIGKPERIVEALEKESGRLSGQSKIEFDAAKPHLVELLRNNFAAEGSGHQEPLIDFSASGSGVVKSKPGEGDATVSEQVQRVCSVSIKPFYARVLL